MENYKKNFIEFLVKSNALKFGEFTLKSGRVSPYFINTGMFKDGEGITKLASYYAQAIKENFKEDFDVLYGPAYKGIPLCVSTVMELSKLGINKGYSFNRKETKDHGEGGLIVGTLLDESKEIVKAILEGLHFLKCEIGLNHRDMKPGNLILVNNLLKKNLLIIH